MFRLLQAVLRHTRNDGVPAKPRARALALSELRNSYLPISNEDARWLRRIQDAKGPELDSQAGLSDLARFYDTHLVLTYRNGEEWVAVHPLLVEQVLKQAAAPIPS